MPEDSSKGLSFEPLPEVNWDDVSVVSNRASAEGTQPIKVEIRKQPARNSIVAQRERETIGTSGLDYEKKITDRWKELYEGRGKKADFYGLLKFSNDLSEAGFVINLSEEDRQTLLLRGSDYIRERWEKVEVTEFQRDGRRMEMLQTLTRMKMLEKDLGVDDEESVVGQFTEKQGKTMQEWLKNFAQQEGVAQQSKYDKVFKAAINLKILKLYDVDEKQIVKGVIHEQLSIPTNPREKATQTAARFARMKRLMEDNDYVSKEDKQLLIGNYQTRVNALVTEKLEIYQQDDRWDRYGQLRRWQKKYFDNAPPVSDSERVGLKKGLKKLRAGWGDPEPVVRHVANIRAIEMADVRHGRALSEVSDVALGYDANLDAPVLTVSTKKKPPKRKAG